MKIKNLIKALFILVLVGTIVLIASCTKTTVDYSKLVSRKSLKIISEHNAYALAVENEDYELPTYAVYKNVNYNNYQKVFDLQLTNILSICLIVVGVLLILLSIAILIRLKG